MRAQAGTEDQFGKLEVDPPGQPADTIAEGETAARLAAEIFAAFAIAAISGVMVGAIIAVAT